MNEPGDKGDGDKGGGEIGGGDNDNCVVFWVVAYHITGINAIPSNNDPPIKIFLFLFELSFLSMIFVVFIGSFLTSGFVFSFIGFVFSLFGFGFSFTWIFTFSFGCETLPFSMTNLILFLLSIMFY